MRGPLLWIILAVGLVMIGSSLISGLGAPEQVDTSVAVSDIRANKVDTATITDRDQILDLTLKDGSKLRTSYVGGQGVPLQELLQSKAEAGELPGGYNVIVPSENVLVTLLVSLLPIAIVVFLLFFFMRDARRWLAHHELRQVAREGHHQGHAADDLRRRRRRG